MKAVVLHQPYATLVALGVKTIETRPSPPNGPMRPDGVRGLPGLAIEPGERIAIVAGMQKADVDKVGMAPYAPLMDPDRPGMLRLPLAFGAVVCTVVVTEALPMEPCPPYSSSFDDRWEPEPPSVLYLGGLDGGPWAFIDGDGPISFVGHLPYGDFAPGRWGWLLTDVEPCAPIPCKGKQGVFELPPEISEALS